MINDELIIRFLAEAGDNGLSKDKLARHIFNAENDFFNTVDFDTVKRQVETFVRRNSQDSYALLEKVDGHANTYRLNRNSTLFTQLSLNFSDDTTQHDQTPIEDQSLELIFE